MRGQNIGSGDAHVQGGGYQRGISDCQQDLMGRFTILGNKTRTSHYITNVILLTKVPFRTYNRDDLSTESDKWAK